MYTFLDTFWGQDEKFTIMQQKRNVFCFLVVSLLSKYVDLLRLDPVSIFCVVRIHKRASLLVSDTVNAFSLGHTCTILNGKFTLS